MIERHRAISISEGTLEYPPAGTLGWVEHVPNPDAAGDWNFYPDNAPDVCYYITESDFEIVPDKLDPKMALQAQVLKLAALRERVERAETAYDELKRELDQQLRPLAYARTIAREEADAQYERTTLYARMVFLASGDRHPDNDIEMKRDTALVYNPATALKWAIENERYDLLVLDKKAFEKAAKDKDGGVPVSIATVTTVWKPYVASNLTHRLPEQQAVSVPQQRSMTE